MKKTTILWLAFTSSTLMLLYSVLWIIMGVRLSSLIYLFEPDQYDFYLSVTLAVISSISSIALGYIIYMRNKLAKSTIDNIRSIENSALRKFSSGENNSGT